MKLITVIGARPQFIKASSVSRAIFRHNAKNDSTPITEHIVHTGQHYDHEMSSVFFEELGVPEPSINLGVSDCSHAEMTGRMLEKLEDLLLEDKPNWVLVYGDTNSTLAGALAASKLSIPVAHVEAGLRSFNMNMPEEINRIITDRVSSALFCPTVTAVDNLQREEMNRFVYNVGDVMYDAALHFSQLAAQSVSLESWGLRDKSYALCTVHRAENTNNAGRLEQIIEALLTIAKDLPIIFPVHPRTRPLLQAFLGNHPRTNLRLVEPLPFLAMMRLLMSAKAVLTDSGGLQKEAFFHHVPCITLREETEWVETVSCGANQLAGANSVKILDAWGRFSEVPSNLFPYGDGQASEKIVNTLLTQTSNIYGR